MAGENGWARKNGTVPARTEAEARILGAYGRAAEELLDSRAYMQEGTRIFRNAALCGVLLLAGAVHGRGDPGHRGGDAKNRAFKPAL